MKTLYLIATLAVFLSACSSPPSQDLSWLEGEWIRVGLDSGQSGKEIWRASDQGLVGTGQFFEGDQLVFEEGLRIEQHNQTWNYIAAVSHNDTSVFFPFTQLKKGHFVAENSKHDFPKKIEYHLSGDTLTAIVSGDNKQLKFAFVKAHVP
ncbi:hypothetical protein KFE98_21265 [bacterium SCSIO 12741]|nr:hypothetical protein KFE98_21265 [bacterium SCSIO 12741]